MNGGKKLLDQIIMNLRDRATGEILPVYIDVFDNSLSRKWLAALNVLLEKNYHLEKNYCFFGWPNGDRTSEVILGQLNTTIAAINAADLGYQINDHFTKDNTVEPGPVGDGLPGGTLIHEKTNWLHRYFEDLQGQSGKLSPFYLKSDATIRWHIRQLNLLCHEYESLVNSNRRVQYAPEWVRPSQLMCWLNAPRFTLDEEDYELFGIETLNRPVGGVFVGVNKSVGKHHWEVFNDEGKDSRVGELVTSTLINQTEAAGDFDIEWAPDNSDHDWQKQSLQDFREWLVANGFNPEDKHLTIGHPQVAQVDLEKSFGSTKLQVVWAKISKYFDVYSITTSGQTAVYNYHWSDADFIERQIKVIEQGY